MQPSIFRNISAFLRPFSINRKFNLFYPALIWLAVFACCSVSAQAQVTTSVALAVTTASGPVTTVSQGTVVTLTATVTPASGSITSGQVNFCDATASTCLDVHLLYTAQLTGGKAIYKFRPGAGNHSYKAVFVGTHLFASSTSSASPLQVTSTAVTLPSSTSISETGSWGQYSLTATVTEFGNTVAPTGNVSFVDTSNGNTVLGSAALGTAVKGVAWPNPQAVTLTGGVGAIVVGDFNGDGLPDIAIAQGSSILIQLGNADGTWTTPASPPYNNANIKQMLVGDFNGDGKQDLAILDGNYQTIDVLLGNGDGTFTAGPSSVAFAASPQAFAMGDFNGDGIADLAVLTYPSTSIMIFLGNGDGSFTLNATEPQGSGSSLASIVAGDFNRDGKMDLAVSDIYDDLITLLPGNGDGTFGTALSVHSGIQNSPMVAADFNGDGKLDLALAAQGASGASDSIVVLTGNGDGTFNEPSFTKVQSSSGDTAMAIGDFNADGIADIALANSSTNTISVFTGNGDGTFIPFQQNFISYLNETGTLVLGIGDLNGDGRSDVIAGTGSIPVARAYIYLTQPTETASASNGITITAAGNHVVDAVYAGDSNYLTSTSSTLNLWGELPVTTTALAITSGGKSVSSVTTGAAVTLTATVTSSAGPVTSGQVNFCNASAAHCTDVHILGSAQLTSSGTASWKYVPGPGQYSLRAEFVENGYGLASSSGAESLSVSPAPAPVYTDALALTYNGYPGDYSLSATLLGSGGSAAPSGTVSFIDTSFSNNVLGSASVSSTTPGFGWAVSQSPALSYSPIAEVSGDFNGDGIPDLALLWGASTIPGQGPYSVTVFLGKGNGTFTTGPVTALSNSTYNFVTMQAFDVNSDGKLDLVLVGGTYSTTSAVLSLLGNGDGSFTPTAVSPIYNQPITGGDSSALAFTIADFNGDGKPDLAVLGGGVYPEGFIVALGKGDGTFSPLGVLYGGNLSLNQIASGDFNGDGIPDIVATNFYYPGNSYVFLGKGDGSFTPVTAPINNTEFNSQIIVGDFNNDGKTDIAFGSDSAVDVYLGNGDGTFAEAPGAPFAGAGIDMVAGDFNHDGNVDFAGVDNYNGVIDLLEGNGDGTFSLIVTTPQVMNFAAPVVGLTAADFNGDGVPDLAMITTYIDTAQIMLTQTTHTFTTTINNLAPVGAGTHVVDAKYSGDSHYSAATSNTVSLTAGLAPLVISPASGTYTSGQTVTISESVPGATIYYEAGGMLNTNGFVTYTGPIKLDEGGSTFIIAYATETGYQQANEITASYNLLLPPAATPVISPAPGYYPGTQTVTITDSTPSATIYYTTNGTLAAVGGQVYSGPITVNSSETITAVAIASGYSYSNFASSQYEIGTSSLPLVYTYAGTGLFGYYGDGGPATQAQTTSFTCIVRDSTGNMYFSDWSNHKVRMIAAGTGVMTTLAGNGTMGYSGDGSAAVNAELIYPGSLALDHAGNLLIADNGNNTVRSVNLSTGIITTYAGDPNSTTYAMGGPANTTAINQISALAVDASNNVYIASYYSIAQVNASTHDINSFAGTGILGYAGDGGPASAAQFYNISGMAFDGSGDLYIADSENAIIRKIAATSGLITQSSTISTVAGTMPVNGYAQSGYTGDGGPATSATLNYPVGLAIDSAGDFFIGDADNNAIRKVTASTGNISTYVGVGVPAVCYNFSGDGAAASSTIPCGPQSLALDASGNLYYTNGYNRINIVTPAAAPPTQSAAAPTFSVSGGTYASGQSVTLSSTTPGAIIYFTIDGTTPTTASNYAYSQPIPVNGNMTIKAIAIAPGYQQSSVASSAYTITASSPLISTVAGRGGLEGFYGAGGPATDVLFGQTAGVAVDKLGNIYVADDYNSIVWLIYASTGEAVIYAGSGTYGYSGDNGPATSAQLSAPTELTLDPAGNLYIADTGNSLVRKVAAGTGIITTYAGYYHGFGFSGDGGPATSAELSSPQALAMDPNGNLYIADTGSCRIREVTASTGIINTVAGNGSCENTGDGGAATSAGLTSPDSVAVDANGSIYIASSQAARVRMVNSSTQVITSVAGTRDLNGNTGDGGSGVAAEVSPRGIALDSTGNLYIANYPGEIRELNTTTGIITDVAGIGYPGNNGDGGPATAAQLYYPWRLALDPAGNIYLSDSFGRIRKVTVATQTAVTPAFSIPAGNYSTAQSVELSSTTPDATIYYTTDGSVPTESSSIYANPITVAGTETINAIAVASGYNPSPMASAAYTISTLAPVPALTGISPAYTNAGGSQFTLTVNGSGFTSASTVYWGSTALTTQFSSASELSATVPASSITSSGIISVTVKTPAPGGGTSNAMQFAVNTAGTASPGVSPASLTVSAGSSAVYTFTLPSDATNVSAQCLNLPSGAACSFSQSNGQLTITTASTTPQGTYTITVVFTETLPGAAALLLPLLLLPAAGKKRKRKLFWMLPAALLIALLATVSGCGGGGSGGGGGSNPQTHQVTSSATVTLTVQ